MSARCAVQEMADRIAAALPEAEWRYDTDTGEMEIVLPGSAGRSGLWVDVADWDFYLRIDEETGAPLSLIVSPFDYWLADQAGKARPAADEPVDYAVARRHIERVLRTSTIFATSLSAVLAKVRCPVAV